MLEKKTIFRGAVSKGLIEGTVRGSACPETNTAEVECFIVDSGETAEGEYIDFSKTPMLYGAALATSERAFLEQVLLEHAVEEKSCAGCERFEIHDDELADYNGGVLVFLRKFTPGNPYGYFNHRTGATEPPTSPEADIALIRDAKTLEAVELTDGDYERVARAIGERILHREFGAEAAYFDRDDADLHDNDPENLGFDESDTQ